MPEMKRGEPAGIGRIGLIPLIWDTGPVSQSVGSSVGEYRVSCGQPCFLENSLEGTSTIFLG